MNFRGLLPAILVGTLFVAPGVVAQGGSEAFIAPGGQTSAVDAKGVRHSWLAHSRGNPPWIQDGAKLIGPDYPYWDRAQHHEGVGLFRLYLDLKTGAVTRVAVLKSTGFSTLDNCAVAAFRKSLWKPGKWKEIDQPVTFKMVSQPPQLPPGAIRLPRS
jgi:TonB family protein